MPNNLDYVSREVRKDIEECLDSACVLNFTKEIIRNGIKMDCVDAVNGTLLALQILKQIQNDMLGKEYVKVQYKE